MNSTRGHKKITKVVKRGVVSRKTAKLMDCQRSRSKLAMTVLAGIIYLASKINKTIFLQEYISRLFITNTETHQKKKHNIPILSEIECECGYKTKLVVILRT